MLNLSGCSLILDEYSHGVTLLATLDAQLWQKEAHGKKDLSVMPVMKV